MPHDPLGVNHLFGEFLEELLGQRCYPLVLVHDALRHFAHVTFDLDHVVQDEWRQNLDAVDTDHVGGVVQPGCVCDETTRYYDATMVTHQR